MIRYLCLTLTVAVILACSTSQPAEACPVVVQRTVVHRAVVHHEEIVVAKVAAIAVYAPVFVPLYSASYAPPVVAAPAPAALPCEPALQALRQRLDLLEGRKAGLASPAPTTEPPPMPPVCATAPKAAPSGAFAAKCLVCHATGGEAKPALDVALTDAIRLEAIKDVLSGKMPKKTAKGVTPPDADQAGEILDVLAGTK